MAMYSRRKVTTVRHEYFLPNPSNWAEVGKAMTAADLDITTNIGSPADDSIWITHNDDEIIIYWEETK